MKKALLIFAKYPTPGEVKTRMIQRLGKEGAANAYQKMVELVMQQTLSDQYDQVLCYTPENKREDFIAWLNPQSLEKQAGNDLGARLEHAFRSNFNQYQAVIVIGSDCTEIDQKIINQAFEFLEQHDLVIGPTFDGGYYLLGTKQFYPKLFHEIDWSTERVFDQTMQRAKELGLKTKKLNWLADQDY